jgi:integrase/recombinase XerD
MWWVKLSCCGRRPPKRSAPGRYPKLKAILGETGLPTSGYLFPDRGGQGPITRQACDAALRKACDRLGLRGYSTHSNRRTWATRLDKAGVRLKAIQDWGASMAVLQRYLEVSEERVGAIAQL